MHGLLMNQLETNDLLDDMLNIQIMDAICTVKKMKGTHQQDTLEFYQALDLVISAAEKLITS